MVPYTRGSPVDTTERVLAQRYPNGHKCSSAALIAPLDSQTFESSRLTIPYPRGFVKRVAVTPPSKSPKFKRVRLIPGLIDAEQDAGFNLCNEVMKRSRALTEGCTAPHARESPIETGAQEQSPTKIIRPKLEDYKRSLTAQERKSRANTNNRHSASSQTSERTNRLKLESSTVRAPSQLSTAESASIDDKEHIISSLITSQPHTREAPATHIGNNIKIAQHSQALVEDAAVSHRRVFESKISALEKLPQIITQHRKQEDNGVNLEGNILRQHRSQPNDAWNQDNKQQTRSSLMRPGCHSSALRRLRRRQESRRRQRNASADLFARHANQNLPLCTSFPRYELNNKWMREQKKPSAITYAQTWNKRPVIIASPPSWQLHLSTHITSRNGELLQDVLTTKSIESLTPRIQ